MRHNRRQLEPRDAVVYNTDTFYLEHYYTYNKAHLIHPMTKYHIIHVARLNSIYPLRKGVC